MTRPQIEFIQTQALPWRTDLYQDVRPKAEIKVLSVDDDSGECSLLVRYPPGWQRTGSEFLSVDEEFFVLDGDISLNGNAHTKHFYAFLPAGYPRQDFRTEKGAVVLTFFSARPNEQAGAPRPGLYDKGLLIEHRDTINMVWDDRPLGQELDPGLRYQAANKTLRSGPQGEWTLLFSTLPHSFPEGWRAHQARHPCCEEALILTGEVTGNLGTYPIGAYFWRPPMIAHGPYGSLTGYMAFTRCLHGTMKNVWTEHEAEFIYDAQQQPVLPPEYEEYLRAHRQKPATDDTRYGKADW